MDNIWGLLHQGFFTDLQIRLPFCHRTNSVKVLKEELNYNNQTMHEKTNIAWIVENSHTSACLKKEQFWFVPESRTTSKNASNLVIDINSPFVYTDNITIRSMTHYKQYEGIILAVIQLTFFNNYLSNFLNQNNNTIRLVQRHNLSAWSLTIHNYSS